MLFQIDALTTDLEPEPNIKYLRWCFGKNLDTEEHRFGYVMKVYLGLLIWVGKKGCPVLGRNIEVVFWKKY